jgi:gliding motility-associated-like protein
MAACAPGGQVTLAGSISGNFLGYAWAPAAGLSDPNSLTPTATVSAPMTYTLTGSAFNPNAPNLVTNPGFEAGNTGFTSSYAYNFPPIAPGSYVLTTSPSVVWTNFPPCDDHTFGNGTGQMMLINGDGTPGDNVWCQTIPVTPNSTYVMSAWATSTPIDPAVLQFSVNGVLVGSPFQVNPAPCFWQQFSASWNSGAATSATVCITNQNSGNGLFGDDYTLDDIYFGGACTVSDQVNVNLVSVNAMLPPDAILPCSAAQTGIVLNGSGSSSGANISYQWTTNDGNILSGANSTNATVNATGTYTLTVTYNNGGLICSASASLTVLPDPNVVTAAAFSPFTQLDCNNPTVTLDGSASSSGPGITYSWTHTPPTGGIGTGILSGGNTPFPVVNQAGTYTLLVTNTLSGCTASDGVTLNADFQTPTANASAPGNLTCTITTLTLSGNSSSNGNFSYQWTTPPPPQGGNIVSGATTLNNCVVNAPGTYTLTVTNNANGCTASASTTVSANLTAPTAAVAPPDSLDCNTPSLNLDGSGSNSGAGFSYQWTTANGNIGAGAATLTPSVDAGGTYTLTVTNGQNGCTASASVTVIANLVKPAAQIATPDSLDCLADSIVLDGSGSSSGAIFSYQWSTANGNILSGSNTPTPIVDAVGVYVLTVYNSQNGCTGTASTNVFSNKTTPVAEAGTGVQLGCNSAPETLDGSGSSAGAGISYQWTTNTGNILAGATTTSPSVDAPGWYFILVTNVGNGCSATDSVLVMQDANAPLIDVVVSGQLDCLGGSVVLDASGSSAGANISLNWTTAGGNFTTGQNTLTPTVDAPGVYTLVLTNTANGCSVSANLTVTQDTISPNANAGGADTLTCLLTTATLDGSGSSQGSIFSYQWLTTGGNIASGDTTLTPVASEGGIYILVVTNNQNGCTATATTTVTDERMPPVASAGMPHTLSCAFPTAVLDGTGSSAGAGISYQWSTPNGSFLGGASTQTPTVNAQGIYFLLVTDSGTGCTAMDSVAVSVFADFPNADAGLPQKLTCTQKQVTLNGSGSNGGVYIYSWASPNGGNIAGGGNTLTPSVDAPGLYFLTVTNVGNGCSATDWVLVSVDTLAPIAEAGSPFTLSCSVTSATLDGSASSGSGSPAFAWTTPNGNILSGASSATPGINAPGSYFLTVTNTANGCTATDTVAVFIDADAPLANAGAPATLTCAVTSAMLDGSGSSMGAGFTYSWTTQDGNITGGSNTLAPTVNAPGTYLLTVINTANSCQTIASVMVFEYTQAPSVDAGQTATLTCMVKQLSLSGNAWGAPNPFVYQWITNNGNIVDGSDSLTPLVDAPGTYTLVVTNTGNGCTGSDSVVVLQNINPPGVAVAAPQTLTCAQKQVTPDATGTSVGANFSYQWTTSDGNIVSGGNSLQPTVNAPGTYLLTVTNTANQCTAGASVSVAIDTLTPAAAAASPAELSCLLPQVALNGTGSSTGANFSYQWTTLPAPQGGGNIVSGSNTLAPIVDAPGTYLLTVTNQQNGCTATASTAVAGSATPPGVVVTPAALLTCTAPAILLDGSASSSGSQFIYQWTSTGGNIVSGGNSPTPLVDAPGTYTLTISNSQNGCTASATVTVQQDTTPPLAEAGESITLTCNSAIDALFGSSPTFNASFFWTTPDGNIVSGETTTMPVVDAAGTYFLTVTNPANGCTASDSVSVLSVVFENFSFETEEPGCLNEGAVVFTAAQGGTPPYRYSIDGGASFSDLPFFENLPPGTYDLLVKDSDGCKLSANANLPEPPPVVIVLEKTLTARLGDVLTLEPQLNLADSLVATVSWTPAGGLNCADCLRPVAAPVDDAVYTLTVVDAGGCSASASVSIVLDKKVDVYVPNVFSPNGDGINDLLTVFARPGQVKAVRSFLVFTRWGESVFELYNFQPNDPTLGWDGTHRGKRLDMGVFAWFAEVELINGERKIFGGDVALLR